MKRTASLALYCLIGLVALGAAPRLSQAADVAGKSYSVFIYSQYVSEPATTITFRSDGVLLIKAYSGFGNYITYSNFVAAVFTAPEYQKYKDLFMIIAGAVVGDFIAGMGVSLTNGSLSEVFLLTGYATVASSG